MIEFECGDARELIRGRDDGSVAFILVDPPYAKRDAYLIDELAPEFRRVLRNDGHAVLICGNYCYADWTNSMRDAGFYEKPQGWLLHTGRTQVRPEAKMRLDGKPIGFYCVDWKARPHRTISNVIRGGGRDKRYHEWGQCIESAEQLIEAYTNPGDLVLDTFAGAATVLAAAYRLGRHAIGYEVDPGRWERGCERVDEEILMAK